MSIWLSPEEVADLTAKVRWTAQCRALVDMCIPFIPNGAGRPLVEREAVVKVKTKREKKASEPNWGALKNLTHG